MEKKRLIYFLPLTYRTILQYGVPVITSSKNLCIVMYVMTLFCISFETLCMRKNINNKTFWNS